MTKPTGLDAQLLHAAAVGDDAQIRDLLARGANVNPPGGEYDDTPLTKAVFNNRMSSVKLLLDAGASLVGNSKNPVIGNSPNLAMAEYLIERGARLPKTGQHSLLRGAIGWGQVDLVRFYLDRGVVPTRPRAPVSGLDGGHLGQACERNRHAIVRLLLERGGSPNEFADYGMTALDAALRGDGPESAILLVEAGATVEPKHLVTATERSTAALVALMLRRTTCDATEVCAIAAKRGNLEMLQIFVESDRVSDLAAVLRAAVVEHLAAVEFLLHCGADPNAVDAGGRNALAFAGTAAIVEKLWAAGARFAIDKLGRTALFYARCGAVVRAIVGRGVWIEERDAAGATAVDVVAREQLSGDTIEAFAELGAANAKHAADVQQRLREEQDANFERMFR